MLRRTKLLTVHDVESALAALESRPCHAGRHEPGFTYGIRDPHTGLVKLGRTALPRARLVNLQCGAPVPLDLAMLVHGAWLEALLHAAHDAVRSHGEWFALESVPATAPGEPCYGCAAFAVQRQDDRAHIRRGHGLPYPFVHGATLRLPSGP